MAGTVRKPKKRRAEDASEFVTLLREDARGSCWLAALAYGEREGQFALPEILLLLRAAQADAGFRALGTDFARDVRAQAAWQSVALALERRPNDFARPDADVATDGTEQFLHVTTLDVVVERHFDLPDALSSTLAWRAVTDASERRRILRRLLRQLKDEGQLHPRADAVLGMRRVWLSRPEPRRPPHGQGDLACRVRDALGLLHLTATHFLVMYVWPDAHAAARLHRRPHGLDEPGARFRAWADGPTAGERWGTAVHLGRLAKNDAVIDGMPETVAPPRALADTGNFNVLALGHPGTQRGAPIRGRGVHDNEHAYALLVEEQVRGLGLDVDAFARRLVEAMP